MQHLAALQSISEVEPIAHPVRRERLSELESQGFQIAATMEAARELGSQLCIVATDTRRHVDDALRAAAAGFDVLVEKPLSTDGKRGLGLCEAVVALGHQVFVGTQLRFAPCLSVFQKGLAALGQFHAVHVECRSYLPDWRPERPYRQSYSARAEDGGVLRDLIHEIDYAGWLFGWPEAVQANVRNSGRLEIESDDAADLIWRAPEGYLVSLSLDYLSRPPRRRVVVFGERGSSELDWVNGTVTLSLVGEEVRMETFPTDTAEWLWAQDQAFVHARENSSSPLASGTDGVTCLAICDAARKSSESGVRERVDY